MLSDKEKLEWFSHFTKSLSAIKLMCTDSVYSKEDILTQIVSLEQDLKSIDSGYLPSGPKQTVQWPKNETSTQN